MTVKPIDTGEGTHTPSRAKAHSGKRKKKKRNRALTIPGPSSSPYMARRNMRPIAMDTASINIVPRCLV